MCKVREVEGVLSMIMPPSSDRLWSGTPITEIFRFFPPKTWKNILCKVWVLWAAEAGDGGEGVLGRHEHLQPRPRSPPSGWCLMLICVVFTTWIVAAAGREAEDPARERGSPAQHDRPPPLLQVLQLVLLQVLILVLLLDLLSEPPVPAFEILQVRLLVHLFNLPF